MGEEAKAEVVEGKLEATKKVVNQAETLKERAVKSATKAEAATLLTKQQDAEAANKKKEKEFEAKVAKDRERRAADRLANKKATDAEKIDQEKEKEKESKELERERAKE